MQPGPTLAPGPSSNLVLGAQGAWGRRPGKRKTAEGGGSHSSSWERSRALSWCCPGPQPQGKNQPKQAQRTAQGVSSPGSRGLGGGGRCHTDRLLGHRRPHLKPRVAPDSDLHSGKAAASRTPAPGLLGARGTAHPSQPRAGAGAGEGLCYRRESKAHWFDGNGLLPSNKNSEKTGHVVAVTTRPRVDTGRDPAPGKQLGYSGNSR